MPRTARNASQFWIDSTDKSRGGYHQEILGQEVDDFLRGLGAESRTTQRGYLEYEFADRSRVHIRTDGEVIRTPAPKYASDGRRLNKGLRLDRDGSLVKTLDEFGNQIPGTHNNE